MNFFKNNLGFIIVFLIIFLVILLFVTRLLPRTLTKEQAYLICSSIISLKLHEDNFLIPEYKVKFFKEDIKISFLVKYSNNFETSGTCLLNKHYKNKVVLLKYFYLFNHESNLFIYNNAKVFLPN